MPSYRAVPIALSLSLASIASTAFADTTIDDFEPTGTVSSWIFTNGSEFPGATGSTASTTGHTGHGLQIDYDFTGGGNYVGATRAVSPLVSARALSFWARTPPGSRITVRVADGTHQTLQYVLVRPFDARDPSGWFHHVVQLDSPSQYWGGANDGVLHMGVTSVTLMVEHLTSGAHGSAAFDDVALLDSTDTMIDPFGDASSVPAADGDLFSRLGVAAHSNTPSQFDAALSGGMNWIRTDLFWWAVEPTAGHFDFSRFDTIVSNLESRGMHPLFIFVYGNPAYTAESSSTHAPPRTQTEIDAFLNYVRQSVTHFAGHRVRWEIWNEPNNDGFWPMPSATEYANLSRQVLAAVHAIDPAAEISTGGLGPPDLDYLHDELAAGAGVGSDGVPSHAIGMHLYRGGNSRPEFNSDVVYAARGLISEAIPSSPVLWDTESGYSSTWFGNGDGHDAANQLQQGIWDARRVLSHWALGLECTALYDIQDDGTDPMNAEHNFGRLANDGTAKPAMTAMRTIADFARGRSLAAIFHAGPSTLHVHRLDGADDAVLVMWSEIGDAAARGHVAVTVPQPMAATDVFGASIPVGTGASVTIDVGGTPLFFTYARPATPDGGVDASSEAGADASLTDVRFTTDLGGHDHDDVTTDLGGHTEPMAGCRCNIPGGSSTPFRAMALTAVLAAMIRRRRTREH